MKRTFKDYPLWFYVDMDDSGKVTSIEEHDNYAGGVVNPPSGTTHEQYFLQRVAARCLSVDEAKAFLTGMRAEMPTAMEFVEVRLS